MAEPAAKKAKTTEEAAPAAEVEVPKEVETDAKAVKGPAVTETTFLTKDTTINAMLTPFGPSGGLLKSLTEGAFQNLYAGVRANVGVKAGRHMFEVKIVELINAGEQRGKGYPHVFKVGFSTSKASLFLGDSEESVCFEMDGAFVAEHKRAYIGKRWNRDAVVSVVLNLDKKSANVNTISLFADGVRACQPKPLPEALKGKTLYPAFTYKNVTAHVNFGPEPLSPLPFKCHMIQGMDKAEADVTAAPKEPADGKYEIMYPVGLPDEGCFEWLDLFLQKNPQYTEISERALLAWSAKSDMPAFGKIASKDKSETNTVDEGSIQRLLQAVAPLSKRDYIVMDMKAGLTKEGRAEVLKRFPAEGFKKVARVVVGEPTLECQKHVRTLTLADKQAQSDKEHKMKQEVEKRTKLQAKRAKENERAKKKAEKAKKKQAEEIKKKVEAAKKAQAAKAAGEEPPKEEEKEEAAAEISSDEEPEEEEVVEMVVEAPKVELTDEEKKLKFYKSPIPDMTQFVLGTSFTKFTLPAKDEGFDELKYEWNKGDKADEYVKKWILERKLTTRVEDIKPSAWFTTINSQWNKELKEWNQKTTNYKALVNKREADKRQKAQRKAALLAQAEAAKKKKEEAKAKAEAEGKPVEEEKEPEKKEEEKEEEEEKAHEDEAVDFDGLDIFGVEDICDLGGSMPLFCKFQAEDWAMIALRFELYALVQAFKRDCDDPERPGMHVDHLDFYYQKYFKKALSPKQFGVTTVAEIVALVQDTVYVGPSNIVATIVPDEFESLGVFAKIAEEARRYRTLRIESGDETARLKVSGGGGHWDNSRGGGQKWDNNKGGDKWENKWESKKWDNNKADNSWGNNNAGKGGGGGGSKWGQQDEKAGGKGGGGGGGNQGAWNSWGNKQEQSGGKSGGKSYGKGKW